MGKEQKYNFFKIPTLSKEYLALLPEYFGKIQVELEPNNSVVSSLIPHMPSSRFNPEKKRRLIEAMNSSEFIPPILILVVSLEEIGDFIPDGVDLKSKLINGKLFLLYDGTHRLAAAIETGKTINAVLLDEKTNHYQDEYHNIGLNKIARNQVFMLMSKRLVE